MKHAKPASKQRLKLILMAAGMAALGVLLIFLHIKIQPESGRAAASTAVTPPTATAPATSPASAPAPTSAPAPANRPAPDPKAASARSLGAMFLLFGLMSFTVSGACVLLIVLDIRKSRPAWKTQTKYPRRR
jgi:hypothetical protein